jgi:hypothetical protein
MPERRPGAGLRRLVAERARHRCEYCLIPARIATQSFSVEHILPWSAGGPTTAANLALACPGCNAHKMTRTTASDPLTQAEVPLFHPRKMRWSDHLAWSADGLRLVGLTGTGRATVEQLQLNRSGLVALREMLILASQHPPMAG